MLLGKPQPRLEPGFNPFPNRLGHIPDVFLTLTKEAQSHAKQRLVEGELAGKVLIERWRLHADHASDFVEVEGCYPIAPHDLSGRSKNGIDHFLPIAKPALLR
jgi:hypothetical protein